MPFVYFCVCAPVLPMFYASLFIFHFFSIVPMSWFCQCSMPLYLYFSCLLCLWLGFPNILCLLICIVFFSFVSDVFVLPMLYASFFIFLFSFVPVAWFLQVFLASLFIMYFATVALFFQNCMPLLMFFFSFLLRMWLI